MADMRERGTSFLTEFCDFVVMKIDAIGLAIGAISGAAFGTELFLIVEGVFRPIGPIIGGVDFSNLFVLSSNPTPAAVPSLTHANGAGVTTLSTA